MTVTAELLRDVCFDNLHAVELCLTFCFLFHHVVFAEVGNVFWVRQILLGCVVSVEFLEMVDLILVLIVTVVARTVAKVR